jgi:phosphoglycerate dehydrogenase-like enzyme
MEVLINDPPLFEKGILKSQHSLDDIITNADIVSLHVPYTMLAFIRLII